jgi:hypothetical protein
MPQSSFSVSRISQTPPIPPKWPEIWQIFPPNGEERIFGRVAAVESGLVLNIYISGAASGTAAAAIGIRGRGNRR